jgi:CubicO group peptidase (beta-lactamase class C family)
MPPDRRRARPLTTALSAAALSALTGCVGSNPQSGGAPSLAVAPDAQTVDTIFAAYDRPGAPGASVIVIRDGQLALSRSYGLADLEARTAATERTNYRLASLSKQFTATAIMLLVKDGRLRYDDRVRDLLPGFPPSSGDITIRHLLTHTSGLWDYEDFVPDTATVQVHDRDVLALLHRAHGTYFAPGAEYRYSNSGYVLLALVVEQISGQPFARFLHDRIFAPTGMDSTVAFEEGSSTVPQRAYGYTERASAFARTDQSPTSATLGDGGIYSSVHDLVAWDRALDDGALVGASALREAWTPATLTNGTTTGYGFGWFVDRDARGLRLSHHGETRGFTNAILKYPEQRLTVVVLTNRTGGAPWDLAARVAELYAPVTVAR